MFSCRWKAHVRLSLEVFSPSVKLFCVVSLKALTEYSDPDIKMNMGDAAAALHWLSSPQDADGRGLRRGEWPVQCRSGRAGGAYPRAAQGAGGEAGGGSADGPRPGRDRKHTLPMRPAQPVRGKETLVPL